MSLKTDVVTQDMSLWEGCVRSFELLAMGGF
jgi:hypothetical protein